MSHTKQDDNEGRVDSCPHNQPRMRARDEEGGEEQRAAHPSVGVSPAMRLYRHALESVLGMLELRDLGRIVAVSREWSAAVRSMAPINAAIQRNQRGSAHEFEFEAFRPLPPIASIVASPLLRHLAAIEIEHEGPFWTPLDNVSLALLAQHAPNLRSLWCTLTLTPDDPLMWPATLTSLTLELDGEHIYTAVNGVLTALAALPSLSHLCLRISALEAQSSQELRLLAACPSLTSVTLNNSNGHPAILSRTQVDQIRSSLGHLRHFSAGLLAFNHLAQLLQPPVTAQWQDLGPIFGDERIGDLLLTLPSLTQLHLDYQYDQGTVQVDFLAQLPLLAVLHLDCYQPIVCVLTSDAVLDALVRCNGLTELDLECAFNSAHWSALFAKLALKKLTIRGGELDTLASFASGPITQSLEELTLDEQDFSPSEVSHLYALRRLRSVHLRCCFHPRLDDSLIDNLCPPTPLLPSLTNFGHAWRSDGGGNRKRQGPSFEWMQQRLTQ